MDTKKERAIKYEVNRLKFNTSTFLYPTGDNRNLRLLEKEDYLNAEWNGLGKGLEDLSDVLTQGFKS